MAQVNSGLRFDILGPLSVLCAGRPVDLGSRKQQLVLAVLLGNANCLVPVETLMAALWDDCQPRTARKNLQVDSEELSGWARQDSPLIVQEYVEHDTELRVYYVDGELPGFEVAKAGPAGPWLAADRVTARPAALAPGVARAARLLARAMSLRFAAFDFLLGGGDAVFLEVNPNGDWRWLETRAGTYPVTSAAGRMLSRLHHGISSRSAPFDLLAFLCGPAA